MSLALLFNRTKPMLDAIELDCSVSETHRAPVRKTNNPVESGAVFTDHIHLLPDIVTLDGVISTTPDAIGASFDPRFGGSGRAKKAWQDLLKLRADRTPFDLFTTLRSYPNMAIKDLSTVRNALTTNALRFTVVCERIEIATVSLIQNLAQQIADQAQAAADLGLQGTGPA